MTPHPGDLLTAALAREIADSGISVYAVTSPASVAAALSAPRTARSRPDSPRSTRNRCQA